MNLICEFCGHVVDACVCDAVDRVNDVDLHRQENVACENKADDGEIRIELIPAEDEEDGLRTIRVPMEREDQ